LLTGMTGISLHMQWPLTSQLHGRTMVKCCRTTRCDTKIMFHVSGPLKTAHSRIGRILGNVRGSWQGCRGGTPWQSDTA
jgi:hypothetical protein